MNRRCAEKYIGMPPDYDTRITRDSTNPTPRGDSLSRSRGLNGL